MRKVTKSAFSGNERHLAFPVKSDDFRENMHFSLKSPHFRPRATWALGVEGFHSFLAGGKLLFANVAFSALFGEMVKFS